MKTIAALQYISQDSDVHTHAEQAKLMYANGIKWVQIRMKEHAYNEVLKQASEALEYAKKHGGILIINDSIEIAKEIGAHGIHLGLKDTPIDEAREQLGPNYIIGGTANTMDDVLLQIKKGADYIGLGPFKFTQTKKNLSPVIALTDYKKIMDELMQTNSKTPIIAVGGISLDDIPLIEEAGLDGVAISSALLTGISFNI